MLIRVRNPAVVFLFEGVLRRIWVGIPALPEGLDKLLSFFVGLKLQKRTSLLRCDDVNHILVKPFLILGIQFLIEVLQALLLGFRGFALVLVGLLVLLLILIILRGFGEVNWYGADACDQKKPEERLRRVAHNCPFSDAKSYPVLMYRSIKVYPRSAAPEPSSNYSLSPEAEPNYDTDIPLMRPVILRVACGRFRSEREIG